MAYHMLGISVCILRGLAGWHATENSTPEGREINIQACPTPIKALDVLLPGISGPAGEIPDDQHLSNLIAGLEKVSASS